MNRFSEAPVEKLLCSHPFACGCDRQHSTAPMQIIRLGSRVLEGLPDTVRKLGMGKPLLVADSNTWPAAGNRCMQLLKDAGIDARLHMLPFERPEPDEAAVGSVVMAASRGADGIIAAGSGVISDICKVTSRAMKLPMITVAAAPSMDGYASSCASMLINGLKTSLYGTAPNAIFADTDILAHAPMRMLQAGLGDMITKYISLFEWRMANLVRDEYCCAETAALVRRSAEICFRAADGLQSRSPEAVAALTEGLLLSGIGVAYVNVSGPASGGEHYISHIWDMQNLQKGLIPELHGIQTGICTIRMLKIYEHLRSYRPDREKALYGMAHFPWEEWKRGVERLFGRSAEKIIEAKYDHRDQVIRDHAARLDRILRHWPDLQDSIRNMPTAEEAAALWKKTGAPTSHRDIGKTDRELCDAFVFSPEVRDRYVGSCLIRDLGLTEEAKEWILE